MSEQVGAGLQIDTGKEKWQGNEIGVDSGIPLMDSGIGPARIIRQFLFSFDPEMLKKIRDKKWPVPSKQELFNAHVNQIRISLWGDGLVPIEEKEYPPRIVVGKKKYKIIVTCEPRRGVLVAERPQTLQQILKPRKAPSGA
jgi:hypothetical protein